MNQLEIALEEVIKTGDYYVVYKGRTFIIREEQ